MSKITQCPRCGGNIVEPAYPGDGDYPVGRMCECEARRMVKPIGLRAGGDRCPFRKSSAFGAQGGGRRCVLPNGHDGAHDFAALDR